MASVRYANPIAVERTSDKVLPFRFNYDTYVAIAINKLAPYSKAIEVAIADDLDQRGLLERVVFEIFEGRSNSFQIEIGRKVPVEISQVIIRACFKNGVLSAAYSINQEDGRFGYTQRIYIGSQGEAAGIRLAPEIIKVLLKEDISQREFMRIICPTIFGAALDPVYVVILDTAQEVPQDVYVEVLVRLMREGKVDTPEDPTNIPTLFRTFPALAQVFGDQKGLDLLNAKVLEDVLEEYPQYREFVEKIGTGYVLKGITLTSVYAKTHTGYNALIVQVRHQAGPYIDTQMSMSERDYRSLYDSCKFREAINGCDTVLRINPANEDALWLKGMCLRELKQFERAIECFNKLLEVNPSRAGAALYAAVLEKCLQSKSAWNESIEVYAAGKLVSLPQGTSAMFANDYNEMGLYLNNQGRFRDALQWYDMALDARPRHAIAWFNKGVALTRMGNFIEAIVCFNKALEVEPKYVDALYSKAGCAVELGQYALALDSYDKVIALNPNDIEAKQCRSRTLKRVNDTNLS